VLIVEILRRSQCGGRIRLLGVRRPLGLFGTAWTLFFFYWRHLEKAHGKEKPDLTEHGKRMAALLKEQVPSGPE
jgi:hypothetical protein